MPCGVRAILNAIQYRIIFEHNIRILMLYTNTVLFNVSARWSRGMIFA